MSYMSIHRVFLQQPDDRIVTEVSRSLTETFEWMFPGLNSVPTDRDHVAAASRLMDMFNHSGRYDTGGTVDSPAVILSLARYSGLNERPSEPMLRAAIDSLAEVLATPVLELHITGHPFYPGEGRRSVVTTDGESGSAGLRMARIMQAFDEERPEFNLREIYPLTARGQFKAIGGADLSSTATPATMGGRGGSRPEVLDFPLTGDDAMSRKLRRGGATELTSAPFLRVVGKMRHFRAVHITRATVQHS